MDESGHKSPVRARTLRRVLRAGVFVVSGILIVAALLFSVVRMALPMMTGYQQSLMEMMSAKWGKPVVFDNLDLSWSGYRPQLVVDNLRLTDGPRIRRLAISLEPWTSLKRHRLSAGEIEIDQPSFTLEFGRDGHWHLGGYDVGQATGGGLNLSRLHAILMQLGQVSIHQAKVRVVNADGHAEQATLNLAARIRANHWSASGDLNLPGLMSAPTRLRASGQFGDSIDATVFLDAENWRLVKAQALVRDFSAHEARSMLGGCNSEAQVGECLHGVPRIDSGRLTGSLWLQWRAGHLSSVHASAKVGNLAVTRLVRGEIPAAQSGISHLSTRIAWQRVRGPGIQPGWRLDADRLNVTTTDGDHWPTQSFHLIRHGEQTEFSAGFADINQLAVWLSTAPLPASYLQLLGSSEPRGQARDIRLHFAGDHLESGYLRLENFGNASGKHLWPVVGKSDGLGGINLTLYKQPAGWVASVDQRDLVLAIPGMFREPVSIDHLAGDLYWLDRPTSVIWSDDLVLDNPDMRSRTRLLYRAASLEGRDRPLLQISTDFDDVPLKRVPAYLPRQLLGGGVLKWLDRALGAASGTAHDGHFVFNGDPDRFPFRHDDGTFSVKFRFNGLDLPYLKRWPKLESASGHMTFLNNGLSANLDDGTVGGLHIGNATLSIADFNLPRLRLTAHARNSLDRYLGFLGSSPILSQSLTRQFKGAGNADLDFNLLVPLDRSEQHGANNGVVASGTVRFDNDRLIWRGTPVQLRALNGELAFRNSDINAKGLKARFDGAPAVVSVQTPPGGQQTRLTAKLPLDPVFSLRAHPDSALGGWLEALKGKSSTDVSVVIPHGGDHFSLVASSDLAGVESTLPSPLGKPAGSSWPASLKLDWRSGVLQQMNLRIDGGDQVKASVDYSAAPAANKPPLGLDITADRADWDRWSSLLLPGQVGARQSQVSWPDFDLQLMAGHLLAMGQDFGQTSVIARQRQSGDGLEVGLDGANLAGDIRIHPASAKRSTTQVDASFQRLYLSDKATTPHKPARKLSNKQDSAQPKSQPNAWDLDGMPAFSLRIRHLRHGKTQLGRLLFMAQPDKSAGAAIWRISSMKWQPNPLVTVTGTGQVQGSGRHQQTSLKLQGQGNDLGALLKQLLGSSPIQGGRISSASAQLRSVGPPTAIREGNLSGSGRFVIEKGRLLDVDTGAARLAGLLSLGALTRRLRLDFRDVVDNGLLFDSLAAKWRLDDGVLTFDPLELKNPSLAAIAGGSSDLGKQTLDYRVKIYADVGMLLPLIGTVAGGPVVGGAILALQQMMKSVDKNPQPTVIYRVTGTFDKPVIHEEQPSGKDNKVQDVP